LTLNFKQAEKRKKKKKKKKNARSYSVKTAFISGSVSSSN